MTTSINTLFLRSFYFTIYNVEVYFARHAAWMKPDMFLLAFFQECF